MNPRNAALVQAGGALWRVALAAATALLLAACGGGGSGGSSGGVSLEPPPPPNSGSNSSNSAAPMFNSNLPAAFLQNSLLSTNNIDTTALNAAAYQSEAQWGIKNSNAHLLHWTRGGDDRSGQSDYLRGHGVTVAIVDGGFAHGGHEDLPNVLITTGHNPSAGNPTGDNVSHGTHVAGIIGAAQNDRGVVGVAPEATLLPIKYLGGESISLDMAYDHAIANHAFVANNSWGPTDQWVRISVAANMLRDADSGGLSAGLYWLETPHLFDDDNNGTHLTGVRTLSLTDNSQYQDMASRAAADEILLVYAQGNTGWNSRTGAPSYCADANALYFGLEFRCVNIATMQEEPPLFGTLNLSASRVTALTISGIGGRGTGLFTASAPVATVSVLKDQGDYLTNAPIDMPAAETNWINVVAINSGNELAPFSNGCGITKMLCMAAPGVNVTSTVPGDDYEWSSGTSMAAPHVTGAAALLKGAFPNLTGAQVADILLMSADGAGDCAAEASKAIECVDDAFGHGILNISAAFTPTSFISFTAGGGNAGAITSSRINLSPAFASAPWRKETLRLAGLDNYGRVYHTRVDLADGVWVTKPALAEGAINGAGIHAAYAAPVGLSATPAANALAADAQNVRHWTSGAGDSARIGAGADERRLLLAGDGATALSWRWRSGRAALPADNTADWWQAAFDDGETHALEWTRQLGGSGHGHGQQIAALYSRGEQTQQAAMRWRWQRAGLQLQLEGGIVRETSEVLGAAFTGAFAVGGARTRYTRAAAAYDWNDTRLFADYLRGSSRAASSKAIVRRITAATDEWTAGIKRGDWQLTYTRPLTIKRGAMNLSYIAGYTPAGEYQTETRTLDLTPNNRPEKLSLLYTTTLPNRWQITFATQYQTPDTTDTPTPWSLSTALHHRF